MYSSCCTPAAAQPMTALVCSSSRNLQEHTTHSKYCQHIFFSCLQQPQPTYVLHTWCGGPTTAWKTSMQRQRRWQIPFTPHRHWHFNNWYPPPPRATHKSACKGQLARFNSTLTTSERFSHNSPPPSLPCPLPTCTQAPPGCMVQGPS
jgi:hypothetical protein